MNLVLTNALEPIAMPAAGRGVKAIAQDGKSARFEGLLLVANYALLGLAFFFATPQLLHISCQASRPSLLKSRRFAIYEDGKLPSPTGGCRDTVPRQRHP